MECITPFPIKVKKTNENIAVPCGKCPSCVARRASHWSFRLMQEGKIATSSHFITLTNDTETIKITKNGFMSVDKRTLQLYFKRLRKLNPSTKIKYYCVGEYGGKTLRPHYHIILFNATISSIANAWSHKGIQNGYIHFGQIEEASIGYTLKYLSKLGQIPKHKNDDRQKEFALMSKGLGKNYLTSTMLDWHNADLLNRMYCNLTDGKKIGMPRYYKQKIYTDADREHIGTHTRAAQLARATLLEEDPNYYRDKFESDKAKFEKMYKNANLNNKI